MSGKTWNRLSPLALALSLTLLWGQPVRAQEIRARVVDEASRSGLEGVTVSLLSPDSAVLAQTGTGPDGFFTVLAPAIGPYLLQVERLGYGTEIRSVTAKEGQSLLPAFVLKLTAIPLDTLQVEAPRGAITPQGVVGFSRPSFLLAGERMATLEKTGISFTSAVRELGAGLRVRSVMVGGHARTCIESIRRSGGSGCNMVAIVLDGIDTGLSGSAALEYVEHLHLYDFESVEYQSPVEAGFRYGLNASAKGALVLWTRGMGPHKSDARGGGISSDAADR